MKIETNQEQHELLQGDDLVLQLDLFKQPSNNIGPHEIQAAAKKAVAKDRHMSILEKSNFISIFLDI